VAASAAHRAIDAVWRIESARLIAGLTRIVRDVSIAEDLAQDALVAALEQWPQSGIPDNPGAWLMATAKRRGIDALRRRVTLERKQELIGRELQLLQQLDQSELVAQVDDVQDDVLRLIFMTCHPVLSREARVALTLRLLGGLSTPEIARAFLVSEGTVAQRIVRAKRTLAEARVPFEVPSRDELDDRLSAVLEVIYLIFNEGYAATSGEHWIRPALCEDALRLGRVLAELMPNEPEVHGLVARVHVIEGVLALGAEQRMRCLEIPAVEQTARVQFGHQLLLGLRRRTPRRLAGRWSSASRSMGCRSPALSPLRIAAQVFRGPSFGSLTRPLRSAAANRASSTSPCSSAPAATQWPSVHAAWLSAALRPPGATRARRRAPPQPRGGILGRCVAASRTPAPILDPSAPLPGLTADMEGPVKGCGSAGRGRGQGIATVITLIFAGRPSRCRMTVSRHRAVLALRAWVGTT
jgi:RNA polymerase sigma factor (sigma-70 family)